MQLFLLYYVSLLYLLVFYKYWRRWALRRRGKTGRKSLKRLRQCAPQILFRIDRQHRQCQQFCHGRYQCILYCFCFYYGIHSQHLSAWLLAASSLHFMWNDVISVISSGTFFCLEFWSRIVIYGSCCRTASARYYTYNQSFPFQVYILT